MTENVGRAVFSLETDTSKFSSGLHQAEGQAKKTTNTIGQSMTNLGGSMKSMGASMTQNITLPIIGVGGAALMMGMKFEDTMNQIATLTNIPKESMAGLRDTIMSISKETAKSPEELGAGAYFILSAGFSDAADAANILKIAAQQSALGMGTVEVTARTTAGLLKAYGEESNQAAKYGDMMTATVKEGAAEASEMATAFANVVPGAAALGIKFEVVGGAMAQMTNKFFSADEAGTALNQLFTQLISPSDDLKANLEGLGFTTEQLLEGLRNDAQGTLKALGAAVEAAGENTGATLFADNVRASRAFVSAFGKDADDTMAIIDRIGNSTGAQSEAWAKLSETDSFAIKKAMNDVKIAMTELGIILLPIIADMAKALKPILSLFGKMVTAFGKMPGPVKLVVVGLLLFLALLGPLLFMMGSFVMMMGALTAVSLPLIGVIVLIAVVILALIVVGWLIYDNWDAIVNFIGGVFGPMLEWLKGVVGSVKETFIGAANDIKNFVIGAFNAIINFIKTEWANIIAEIILLPFLPLRILAMDAFGIRTFLINAFQEVLSFLLGHWPEVAALVSGPFFPIVALATDAFGIRSALIGAFEAVLQFLIAAVPRVYEISKSIGKAVFDGIIAGLGDVGGAILDKIPGGGVISDVGGAIFGHAKGLWEVPGTGSKDSYPAALAPGEMVIPSELADIIRSLVSGAEGGGRDVNITVNNPQPAAAEDSLHRQMLNMSFMGI
jgi:TP901 family phage tail tape measure protein